MDVYKAIEWQKAFKKTYNGTSKEVDEACDMAIEALEKQLPKHPICHSEYTDRLRIQGCPKCGRRLNVGVFYCIDCGQAINWN